MISVWRRKGNSLTWAFTGGPELLLGVVLVPHYSPSLVRIPLVLCVKDFQVDPTWLFC